MKAVGDNWRSYGPQCVEMGALADREHLEGVVFPDTYGDLSG